MEEEKKGDGGSGEELCTICYTGEIDEASGGVKLTCGHSYHLECL